MAAAYTRRLGSTQLNTAGTQTIYAHSGTETVIIRDLVVAKSGAGAADFSFYMATPGGARTLWAETQLAAGASKHLELRQELLSGESLELYGSAAGLNAVVTGYRFGT